MYPEDKTIIGLFFDRNELALSYTEKKYGNLCRRVADNILHTRRKRVTSPIPTSWTVPSSKRSKPLLKRSTAATALPSCLRPKSRSTRSPHLALPTVPFASLRPSIASRTIPQSSVHPKTLQLPLRM